IFSLGLGFGGMTQPQKIINFLNPFEGWDPSLLFVMAGAVGLHFFTYRFIRKRSSPLLSVDWHVPSRNDFTARLAIGSALFGLGWGLAGYCPGPSIVALTTMTLKPFVFVGSMIVGMVLFRLVE